MSAHGIFSSCEMPFIARAVWDRVGATADPTAQRTLYIFEPSEAEALAAVIAVGLYFFWNVNLCYSDGTQVMFSHDECYGIVPGRGQSALEALEILRFDQGKADG